MNEMPASRYWFNRKKNNEAGLDYSDKTQKSRFLFAPSKKATLFSSSETLDPS